VQPGTGAGGGPGRGRTRFCADVDSAPPGRYIVSREAEADAVTTEILYCARCRRVIRPKEIAEGKYHFADGEPVCAECFTRLSRRLRPISGVHEPPKPVDISELTAEIAGTAPEAEPKAEPQAAPPEPKPAAQPAAKTSPAAKRTGPGLVVKILVLLLFVLAGALAGAGVYLAMRGPGPGSGPQAGDPQPPPAVPAGQGGGGKGTVQESQNPANSRPVGAS
jgi:hypothetical protein